MVADDAERLSKVSKSCSAIDAYTANTLLIEVCNKSLLYLIVSLAALSMYMFKWSTLQTGQQRINFKLTYALV